MYLLYLINVLVILNNTQALIIVSLIFVKLFKIYIILSVCCRGKFLVHSLIYIGAMYCKNKYFMLFVLIICFSHDNSVVKNMVVELCF